MSGASGETPSGLPYNYLISGLTLFSGTGARGMYCIELPFYSAAHIVGIPQSLLGSVTEASLGLEAISLEGDYPRYFQLYAEAAHGQSTRYVLDPKAMSFTIEFCQQFMWEIQECSLYFMSDAHLPSFSIVDSFIQEIRPAIDSHTGSTAKNPAILPLPGTQVRTLLCPICSSKLTNGDQWLACPNNHGCLVTGAQILALRRAIDNNTQPVEASPIAPTSHSALICPYCHNAMQPSHYGFTDVEIDICTKCKYRWFDNGELQVALRLH